MNQSGPALRRLFYYTLLLARYQKKSKPVQISDQQIEYL